MRAFAVALLVLLTPLLLAIGSCDDPQEDIPGDDEAMSAEELYAEVLQATAALDNVQIDTTSVRPDETTQDTRIVQGEYEYSRHAFGELEEFCDSVDDGHGAVDPPDICEYSFGETLWYGDEIYQLRNDGVWVNSRDVSSSGTWLIAESIADGIDGPTDSPEVERARNIIGIYTAPGDDSVELVGEETLDGEQVTRLRFQHAQDIPDVAEWLAQLEEEMQDLPPDVETPDPSEFADHFDTTFELLVGEDYLPRRLETRTETFYKGEQTGVDTATGVFSHFNTAEIPGTLPE